jgi:uncharacterized protein (TIRG00374 family)
LKAKFIRSALHLLISLGIVVAFVYYLYINADKYLDLLNISKTGVLMLFLLSLAFPLLSGVQNTYLYNSLGLMKFSQWDGILITAASTLANQLPVPGGIISKGYYLKQKHNLSYTKFTSSTIALYFCYLAVNGLLGIAVLLYWIVFNSTAVSPVLLIAFVMMVACLLVFWLPLNQIRMPEKMHRWAHQAIDGWMVIGRNPRLLLKIAVSQAALVVLLSLRYWIAFHMLSQNVTMGQTLLFASATILTQLVSIAPGGLGVREAIVAGVASLLGFDMTISMVAIGLDRLVSTVEILLVGIISTNILGKQVADDVFAKSDNDAIK